MLAPHLGHRDLDDFCRLVRARPRPVRPIRQSADLLGQIARDPSMHRRPVHPDLVRDLDHVRARQHRPDRVETLLHPRQDNQCQSRPP